MKSIITITFLFFSCILVAQDSLYLSLDRVIEYIRNDNLEVKQSALQIKLAEAEHDDAKSWWLPEVFIGTRLHNLTGSVLNSDGRIFEDIDRSSRWYGGAVSVDWNIAQGIYGSKAKKLAIHEAGLRNQANTNKKILEGITLYYNVLNAAAKKELFNSLITQKDDLIQQLTIQSDAGLRLESELLMAQSNRSRLANQALESGISLKEAMQQLLVSFNMNGEYMLNYDMADLAIIENAGLTSNSIDQHPSIAAANLKTQSLAESKKAATRDLFIPKAGLSFNSGSFGADYSTLQNTSGLNAYIGWQLPLGQLLFNGEGKAAEVKYQMAAIESESEQNRISNQVEHCKRILVDVQAMLDLSKAASTYSNQALEQAIIRQKNGIGNAYEVMIAQEEFILSQTMYLDAVVRFNLAEFGLRDASGEKL